MSGGEDAGDAPATERDVVAAPGEVIVVVGPTASGKTDLAIRLAERVGGEVVSADSIQIYKHFDLGSGKPTAEERGRARHHLVDAVEPDEDVDAAAFAARASAIVDDLLARGVVPIVCGGTYLWVRALLFGLAASPSADPAIRARHKEIAEASGRAALHAMLAEVDPVLAARLHANDFVRVSRGLEVFEASGTPLSAWQAQHGFETARYAFRQVGIRRSDAALTARIEARARAWLDGGWIDEVRDLGARGFGATRAMKSVGYREVSAHLAGEIAAADLLVEVVRATRVFARRQRTWLRDQPVRWLDPPG